MDRSELRIPVVVTAKTSENLFDRKGQGSPATIVSRELVDPKATLTDYAEKGNPAKIPEP